PVDAVGNVAAGQREERDRDEDGEARVGQHHRVAGQVVQVPADGDRLHLHGEAGAEPAGEEQVEVFDYCFGMPARSTTCVQRFTSLRKKARSSSELVTLPSTPRSPKRFWTAGSASAWPSASRTLSSAARG